MVDGLLAAIFEKARDGLCLVGADNRVIMADAGWLEVTGLTAGQVVGKSILDLHPTGCDLVATMCARVRDGETVEVPRHRPRLHGRELGWEGTLSPVRLPEGMAILVSARWTSEGILMSSERERLMKTLVAISHRLSLARLRHSELDGEIGCHARLMNAFLQSLGEGVVIVDAARRVVLMNQAAREMGGMSDEEAERSLTSRNALVLRWDGTPWPPEEKPVSRALRGERFSGDEIILVRGDGSERRVAVAGCGVQDAEGSVALAILVYCDVAEQSRLKQTSGVT